MDYHLNNEIVPLERWGWGVVYRDGSELKQFGEDGMFHQFQEIVQEDAAMFTMYRTDDMTRRTDVEISSEDDVQIFHFYRNLVLDNDTRRVRVYVFGWKDRKTGACSYHFILPDDRIVCATSKDVDLTRYQI